MSFAPFLFFPLCSRASFPRPLPVDPFPLYSYPLTHGYPFPPIHGQSADTGSREQFEEFDDALRGLRVAVAGLLGNIILEGSTPVAARREAACGMVRYCHIFSADSPPFPHQLSNCSSETPPFFRRFAWATAPGRTSSCSNSTRPPSPPRWSLSSPPPPPPPQPQAAAGPAAAPRPGGRAPRAWAGAPRPRRAATPSRPGPSSPLRSRTSSAPRCGGGGFPSLPKTRSFHSHTSFLSRSPFFVRSVRCVPAQLANAVADTEAVFSREPAYSSSLMLWVQAQVSQARRGYPSCIYLSRIQRTTQRHHWRGLKGN